MQLKKKKTTVAASLAAATCTLLGTAPAARGEENRPSWNFDTALLYYGEQDGRVNDVSLNMLTRKEFGDEKFLKLGLAVDSLTGASPNGATASGMPQTFTRPSGNGSYTISAGEIPLDDTFLDTRIAVNASWDQPLWRLYRIDAGLSVSDEYDYTSVGGNARISRDFNGRNTTVSAGVAFAADDLDPVGGAPIPLSEMLEEGNLSNKRGSETKDVTDFLLGLTQVVSRRMIVQVNYSYSDASGYLTDPYKLLSVIDPVTGDPVMGPSGGLDLYRYESRPDSRTKQSVFTKAKYHLERDIVEVSYRYMTDDWDIDSHTVDFRYTWNFGNRRYLQPHVRYYTQTAAEFFRTSLVDGDPLPAYASADYRLGELDALTLGLKYGFKTARGAEWSTRLEYYTQMGKPSAGAEIGSQAGQDLFPDLNALIAQVSYRFKL